MTPANINQMLEIDGKVQGNWLFVLISASDYGSKCARGIKSTPSQQ